MHGLPPRAVFVTRETEYELLLARHGTREQARFFLGTTGQDLEPVAEIHDRFQAALRQARSAVPDGWRQALVRRADLDRFLFAPDDIVVPVGQDGLVANVAKYLDRQPVLGVNPLPHLHDGVLVRLAPEHLGEALLGCHAGRLTFEERTMAQATLDSGDRLLALNELFIGHRSHQSARYRIMVGEAGEEQSSSGLIVATGTGATGWARSIMEATGLRIALGPAEPAIAFFVREPFPSIATGTSLRAGRLDHGTLSLTSRMNEGGVVFADGIEQDRLEFAWGRRLSIGVASRRLRLASA